MPLVDLYKILEIFFCNIFELVMSKVLVDKHLATLTKDFGPLQLQHLQEVRPRTKANILAVALMMELIRALVFGWLSLQTSN